MTQEPLSFRQVQIVWGVAIAFGAVCIVFGGFTRKVFYGGVDWRHGALIGLAVWSLLSGFLTHRRLLNLATLKARGSDPTAANTWTAAQLISIMLAESIVLWGLVSNTIIASPQWLSDLMYVAGVMLLFRFKPSNPGYVA